MDLTDANHSQDFNQYRGIYLKRIPTYSFPLMLELMKEFDVGPDTVLKNTGMEVGELDREDTLVSFIQALKMIRNILATSPRPDVGLLVGDRYQINTYGVLGYAMMSCPSWGDALRLGRDYHSVASSLVTLELEYDEAGQSLSYIAVPFYKEMVDIEPFTVEKLFASLIAVSRPLLAKPALPKKVSFAYPEPAYVETYRKIFRCPIEFNAEQNRFDLDGAVLQQPMLMANAMSAGIGHKLCRDFMQKLQGEAQETTHQVAELLLATPGEMPGMEFIAAKLHLGERTLRRKLQAENTTFQDVVDQLRQDLSKHYLSRSQLSLDAIAQLVGFTETTNFRRAFKRWEGLPPAQYRRAQVIRPGSP
jgi:AraC-like DNA-binding protein